MQINRVVVKGFLGIHEMDISPEELTLICGFNETGKSSIAQAIGFAMRGIPERVKLKKNFGDLVNDDFDAAEILVDTGVEQIAVRIKKSDGKTSGLPNPENISDFMHVALDMHHFTNMDPQTKRRMIFKLAGVGQTVEKVMEMLEKTGVNMKKAGNLKTMLTAGFDAAAKVAKDEVIAARALWKATTGEVYGSEKAEHWSKPVESTPRPETEITAEITPLKEKRLEIDALMNQSKSAAEQQEVIRKNIDDIVFTDVSHDELSTVGHETQQRLVKDIATLEAANADMAKLKSGNVPSNILTCPNCQRKLVYKQESLEIYDAPESNEEAIAELSAEIEKLANSVNKDRATLKTTALELAKYERKTVLTEQLNSLKNVPMADVEDCQGKSGDLTIQIAALEEQLQESIRITRENDQAEKATTAATRHHKDILEWKAIEAQLLPDGIPKTLMSKSLDPLNQSLSEQAQIANWPIVQIDENMVITYAGRAYDLCSDSAQWRIQAMLAAAISFISNIGFIILDRADVLDLRRRGQMLDWAKALNKKGLQLIICATLKQKPEIEGIKTVWLGGEL